MKFLKEYKEFEYEIITEEIGEGKPSKLFVKGVIQRADTLNQNGRIYPRNILFREMENYKKVVIERRAMGELDHCLLGTTEVLTKNGWKRLDAITQEESVYSYNLESGDIELQSIVRTVKRSHKGTMYRLLNGKKMDITMTPQHKVLLWDRQHKPYYITAEELHKELQAKSSKLSHSTLRSTGNWAGKEIEEYRIPHTSSTLDARYVKMQELDYEGDVYCLTVPNGNFLIRSNDYVCWTGNCDEPTVNLKNVSHLITDIWTENEVVYGKIEILPTPMGNIARNLIESNVKIGISSRALGSVKSRGDADIVQDDLHLICWDLVSEPSTPNAYLMKEARDVDPRILKKIFSKTDRIDRIANDILGNKKV